MRVYLDVAPVIYLVEEAQRLAAALIAGCDAFLTNDRRLQRVVSIKVEIV